MKKTNIEIIVGFFIFLGIIGMAYISIQLGNVDLLNSNQRPIKATFTSISGLRKDTSVEISGVRVGTVKDFKLMDYQAIVTLMIDNDVEIQEDAIASIKNKGILGAKYVEIIPGGSDILLEPGETIFDTEPPFELMTAIKGLALDNE